MSRKKLKTNKLKKDMTINDLAIMVQEGFSGIQREMDKRFIDLEERMDKRFELVDKRFDAIEHRLDVIENKIIARHEKEIEHLRDRLLRLEAQVAKLS